MNAGLADPYLKTARAKEHLEDLRSRLCRFYDSQPVSITREDDLEQKRHIIRIRQKSVPEVVPLVVGDFLYCVRSSLDQLVWALARLSTPYPRGTQFPILEAPDPKTFSSYTRGVPTGALAIIESLQPYMGADFPFSLASHHLWRLNKLCNIDKHRRIPSGSNIASLNFPDFPGVFIPDCTVDNDAGVVSAPISLKRFMRLDPGGLVKVVFGDPDERIECDFEGLEGIYDFVANACRNN